METVSENEAEEQFFGESKASSYREAAAMPTQDPPKYHIFYINHMRNNNALIHEQFDEMIKMQDHIVELYKRGVTGVVTCYGHYAKPVIKEEVSHSVTFAR